MVAKSSAPLNATDVVAALAQLGNSARAEHSARFFKTGPGQYGEGDRFLGLSVGDQRKVAKQYRALPRSELASLLRSPIHEHRLTALIILVDQYERADAAEEAAIYDFYVAQLAGVNNWDLVDSSAHQIVGEHLLARDRRQLHRWAQSKNMWERRVAIIATYAFITKGEFADTFAIAERLLNDDQDLIHKAVGWMLREVGRRVSPVELRRFLTAHAAHMPRTALRYAIEHFSDDERARWLKKR